MLAKKNRLPIQRWLKNKPRKIISRKSSFFIIRAAENNLPLSRFGVIISRKVARSAVKRNKIKRTIFNFIRRNKYHETKGKDVLIMALPLANQLAKTDIEAELKNLL